MTQNQVKIYDDAYIYIDMYNKAIELTLELIEAEHNTITLVLNKEKIQELIDKLEIAKKNL